ncbi:MAG: GlsB/YeaQ/YmgE family stress response membrane protein [Armatimonadaceae bacterium]
MNLIVMILVGLIAGAIAKALMPGTNKEPSGWVMTILLGIGGAMVGGWLGGMIGIRSTNIVGEILVSSAGAMVIIGLMRALSKHGG